MERYLITPSDKPGWLVVHDKESGVILRFEKHRFNETQEVQLTQPITNPVEAARVMREIGDYMCNYHQDLIF